jgi:hypothetical protein
MPVALLDGRVDLGLWHRAMLLIPPQLAGLRVEPLREPASLEARRELSAAVVLYSRSRPEVAAVCRALEGVAVRRRQQELLELDPQDPALVERYWLR